MRLGLLNEYRLVDFNMTVLSEILKRIFTKSNVTLNTSQDKDFITLNIIDGIAEVRNMGNYLELTAIITIGEHSNTTKWKFDSIKKLIYHINNVCL